MTVNNAIWGLFYSLAENDWRFAEHIAEYLPLKKDNPKEYFKKIIPLLLFYSKTIIEHLDTTNDEDFDKIIIPDNWTWKDLEKLLTKEEALPSEIQS